MIDLPTDPLARLARLRSGARLPEDVAWLRVRVSDRVPGWAGVGGTLVCDCLCRCHFGPCGLPMDLQDGDCDRGCRTAHILGSDCNIDEGRKPTGVHV